MEFRSDVEESASSRFRTCDWHLWSIEEKALRLSQQTQSFRQNKIWSKSKIRISSPSDPPLLPQFRYSNFQSGLIPHWQHLKDREKRGRDLQLSKVWSVYLVLRRWDLVPPLLWDWMSIPFYTTKALSRTGLEPASPDAGLENNLSDRDLKKKEEKELRVGAYITDCLLTKASWLSTHGYSICAQGAASPSHKRLPRQDWRLVIFPSPPSEYE